jgi:DNA invertase Pin-like site-specific DNA recombinase
MATTSPIEIRPPSISNPATDIKTGQHPMSGRLAAAKARGRVGGRRPKIAATDRAAVREFAAVHGSGAACAHFGLSRPTLARYLAE